MSIGAIIGIVIALLFVSAAIAFVIQTKDKTPTLSAEVVNSGSNATPSSTPSSTPAGKGFLLLNETLKSGIANAIYSKNTLYMIILQDNGELQVRKGGITLWRTNIFAPEPLKGCYAKLETTGMVVRDAADRVIWQMLSKEYVSQLQLDIQKAVLDDSGSFTLRDAKDKVQYTLNLNRLPAIADKTKIDDKTFIGSMCNDAVLALSKNGQLVHATCHPSNKDKCVSYVEGLIMMPDSGITSVECSKGKFTYKITGKSDQTFDLAGVLGNPAVYMITMNHQGDWLVWADFNSYMNQQSIQKFTVGSLCGDRLALNTSYGPDFTIVTAPYTLRAYSNPYWMQINESGEVRLILQHLDQKIDRELKKMPGIPGFKSDQSRIVVCFGPVLDNQLNIQTLDVVTIALVDMRPADQLDSRITYGYVADPNKQIQIKPPTVMTENTIVDQIATQVGYSRVAVVHQINVPVISHILAVSDYGGITFKTANQQFVTLIQ